MQSAGNFAISSFQRDCSHGCGAPSPARASMFRDGLGYRDLGAHHFDRHEQRKTISRLVRRLEDLGVQVEIRAAAQR